MVDPITTDWGKVDWVDYTHNWREKDAEWLQARTILRYENTAAITALGAVAPGTVVYNDSPAGGVPERLEMRTKAGTWKPLLPMPANLKIDLDTTAQVALSHGGAAGKGITFTPADIKVTGPLDVLNGVVKVDTTGLDIKTGASSVSARLSTDTTALVVNQPVKVTSLSFTGTGAVVDATGKTINVGTLAATAVTATTVTVAAGGTLTAPTINGTAATIGTVGLNTLVAPNANAVVAPGGIFAGMAQYTSDGAKAVVQARDAVLGGGTLLAGKIEVDNNVGLSGTLVNLNADTAVRNKSIGWYDAANVLKAYYATAVYSATDPGATLFPEGTIWFS